MTLWQRVVTGDGLRRTRFHDYEERAVGLAALWTALPRAATTTALLEGLRLATRDAVARLLGCTLH